MKLVLQKRKKYYDCDEYYYDYTQLEIESFEWGKNHTFEYVIKGSNMCKQLEDNEEIIGLWMN